MSSDFYDKFWEPGPDNPPKVVITEGHCNHKKGDCIWGRCPNCRQKTLHRYMIVKDLHIIDLEKCVNCEFSNEVTIR